MSPNHPQPAKIISQWYPNKSKAYHNEPQQA